VLGGQITTPDSLCPLDNISATEEVLLLQTLILLWHSSWPIPRDDQSFVINTSVSAGKLRYGISPQSLWYRPVLLKC